MHRYRERGVPWYSLMSGIPFSKVMELRVSRAMIPVPLSKKPLLMLQESECWYPKYPRNGIDRYQSDEGLVLFGLVVVDTHAYLPFILEIKGCQIKC